MLKNLLANKIIKRFIGFSSVGVVSTLTSMLLTFILIKIIGLSSFLTYFISYVSTIFLSYYLNSRLVFKSTKSTKNLIQYFIIYLLSFLIGMGTLYVYHLILPFDELILNYMVIPITLLWNFAFSTRIFTKKQHIN